MTVLGLSSKREVTRTSIRVRTAMAIQTRDQGRYLGGRPPYWYRLADAGPHPNKMRAAWGRLPTAAVTGTPAHPPRIPDDRRTPTSAKTRRWSTCPPCTCC
jgi:hypothetical protein